MSPIWGTTDNKIFLPSIYKFRVVYLKTLLWPDACSTDPQPCLVLSPQALSAETSLLSDMKQTLLLGLYLHLTTETMYNVKATGQRQHLKQANKKEIK